MDDIQTYIKLVKKELAEYISMIFEQKYEKNIFEQFLEKYLEIRYFNVKKNIKDKKDLRNTVIKELNKETQKMSTVYEKNKVRNMNEAFSYIIYFDDVGKYIKISNIIEKIVKFRQQTLNIETNDKFTKQLLKLVMNKKEEKENYIKSFFVDYFKLKHKKTNNENVDLIKLVYNIKFPTSFSSDIVQEMFNTDITGEDKLIVEYHMINAVILDNLAKGKFYKQYIIEFATSLLAKKSKLERVLKVISSEFQKEKINLLIEYKDFNEDNKSEIYDLMRRGYKIAIYINESFNIQENDTNKLNVFSYIIVNEKSGLYNELYKNKEISKKILKV